VVSSLPEIKSVAPLDSRGDVHALRVESAENHDARERLARVLVEKGFGLLGLSAVDMSLEEIFVEIVTREELE
jgi:hypothetical protein